MANFATLAHPLHGLLKKDARWDWSAKHQTSFDAIRACLSSAPVLSPPNFDEGAEKFVVTSDASIFAIGAVLTQGGRPIAFESRKLIPAECNYLVTDLELLAVVHALKKWRCYLEGKPFTVQTDHKPLTHLPTQLNLNRRQARWSEFLQGYHFDSCGARELCT